MNAAGEANIFELFSGRLFDFWTIVGGVAYAIIMQSKVTRERERHSNAPSI